MTKFPGCLAAGFLFHHSMKFNLSLLRPSIDTSLNTDGPDRGNGPYWWLFNWVTSIYFSLRRLQRRTLSCATEFFCPLFIFSSLRTCSCKSFCLELSDTGTCKASGGMDVLADPASVLIASLHFELLLFHFFVTSFILPAVKGILIRIVSVNIRRLKGKENIPAGLKWEIR